MSIINFPPAPAPGGDENDIQEVEHGRPRVANGDVYLVPAQDRRRAAEDFRGDADSEGGTIDHRWGCSM